MQPTTSPAIARPIFPIAPENTIVSSTSLVIGFVLALVGFVVERVPGLLIYLYVFSGAISIVEYAQISGVLSLVGYVLAGTGLFLLLRQLVRRLLSPSGYLRFTPLVVLVGTAYLTVEGLSLLWILPALYGTNSTPPIPLQVYLALQAGGWAAEVAIGGAVLVSLFGAALAMRTPPVAVRPPTGTDVSPDYHFQGPPEKGYK